MPTQNEQFEIPGIVRIEPGNGGLTRIVVTTPLANAEIYLHGAHVTRFQPAGQKPVIWMSKSSWFDPAKPIRGGVPICFPWFGPNANDPKAPAHGYARIRDWAIESIVQTGDGSVVVTLSLDQHRHIITIGSFLEMKLEIRNTANVPLHFEEALHTYLSIGDIHEVSVEGLGGSSFIDKVDGARIKEQTDPQIRFTGETDRVYLDTQATCIVNDPVGRRRLEISKSGSNATVVWNPWINKAKAMPDFGDDEWPGMLCVETANVAKHAIDLAPGATHVMTAKVRVCPNK